MAGNGYVSRGYTTHNEMEPRTDDWNKGNGYSDHVCRPVIVDAEGRKKPIIFYTANHNTESYAIKRETMFEHVHVPTHGFDSYRWRRPSTTLHDRPPEVEEFITNVQTEVSRPTRTGPLSAWPRNTSNSTGHSGTAGYGDYGNFNNGNRNNPSGGNRRDEYPDGYYRKNDNLTEPTTAVDKEPVKPSSFTTAGPQPRFTTPFSTVPKKDNYGETIDRKDWNKPSGGNRRDGNPDDYYRKNDNLTEPTTAVDFLFKEPVKSSSITAAAPQPRFTTPLPTVPKRDTYTETIDNRDWSKPSAGNRREENPDGNYRRNDSMTEPTTINKGGWERPSSKGWTTPPSHPITKLTNDIGEAVDFLKEPVKSSSITATAPQPRFTAPIAAGLKKDTYTETIDSREAARRYARPFPFKTEETFTGTIDSREAMKKYNGSIVPL